jgi:outer membrane lipoprotein SlyB
MKAIRTLAGLAAVAALAGCASDPYYYQYGDSRYSEPRYAPAPAYYGNVAYTDYGRVVAIDVVHERGGTSGAGAVIGGVVGGVLGHQVGSGRGNTAATAAGAIGGAVVGNEIEKRRGDEAYRITVEFRDGRTASFLQDSPNGLRVGDRVRVSDNRLYRD